MDKSCVKECLVDCIYENGRSLYINPHECVDCRACKLICRVEAIYYETGPPPEELVHRADNAGFFNETLPGCEGPLGAPGGAATVGRVGVDTPMVAGPPPRRVTASVGVTDDARCQIVPCEHTTANPQFACVAGNSAGGQWHRQTTANP